MSSLPRLFCTAVLVLLVGSVFEARFANRYRSMLATQSATAVALQRQTRELREETAQLRELARVAREAPPESAVPANASGSVDPAEVVRWLSKVRQLKHAFVEQPAQRIPQLALLTDVEWVSLGRYAQLDTEEGIARALAEARVVAKGRFAGFMFSALKSYLEENRGDLPAELSELLPYLEEQAKGAEAFEGRASPAEPAMLAQYVLTVSGPLKDAPAGTMVVKEKSVVNEKLDNRIELMRDDNGSLTFINSAPSRESIDIDGAVETAVRAFVTANQGMLPSGPDELLPFLDAPVGQAIAEALIQHPMTPERQKLFQDHVAQLMNKSR